MIYVDLVEGFPQKKLNLVYCPLRKERHGFVCDHYVMVLLVKGQGAYIEEDTGIEHKLEQGNIYQRFPGKPHAQVLDTDDNMQFFLRVPTELFTLLKDRGQLNLNPVLDMQGDVFSLFKECFIDCERANDGAYSLWRIKDLIVKLHSMSLSKESLPVIEKTIIYLEKRIHKRLSLSEVAAIFNMSYISFRRKFKAATGVSPGAWLIQKRVAKAVELLMIDSLSIEDISHYLGYPDIYTFSKQFKKEKGLPPSEYRQTLLNGRIKTHT